MSKKIKQSQEIKFSEVRLVQCKCGIVAISEVRQQGKTRIDFKKCECGILWVLAK